MKFLEIYNPAWKTEFEKIKVVLQTKLPDLHPPIDIQHVGSTSIPGMIAKPILDIDIITADPAQLSPITQALEKIGYQSKGEQEIPGRFAFRQSTPQTPETALQTIWQAHHLYVCLRQQPHNLYGRILESQNCIHHRSSRTDRTVHRRTFRNTTR